MSITSSRLPTVAGDDDFLAITKQLCAESRQRQIIPIVGMGGIGKTTLARNVYHDPSIQALFDICGWVTVSQSYSDEEVLSTLLRSFKPEVKGVEESHGSMGTKVSQTLMKRKYLIVMDDIWDIGVCDDLSVIFPDDGNGSRIILTTRLQDVATYGANSSPPHEMQLMHEDQSWELFRQKVFMNRVCDRELKDIGMAIARSCGGLPLAIVVTAGLLSTVDRARASWEEFAEKVKTVVAARDGPLEKILSLSYTDLPRHLKQCFAYMGGFPEDRDIHVEKLIKLWIAEGFINDATSAPKSLEEVGEECLQDLIKRSLVFDGRKNLHGKIKSCRLHDLIRDLCKEKADQDKIPLYDTNVHGTLVETTLEDVERLRVLEWGGADQGLLSTSQIFSWLSGLRYLVLDCLVELPAAVSNLENLQTLIINVFESWVRLPREIWRMQQLRHLVSSFDQLPCPQGATSFPLENLQTLSRVSNLDCTYRLVKMIPNIKKLGILYSSRCEFEQSSYLVDDFISSHPSQYYDGHLENLKHLHQLEELKVQVYPGIKGMSNPIFPQSLKKLSLRGWIIPSWRDMAIVGSLPNLQVLKLRELWCEDDEWETAEDEFGSLSFLLIERCGLRKWMTGSDHFPKLKKLLLHQCPYLEEIPADVGDFPSLELIEVEFGNRDVVNSAKGIEEEQKDMGNDNLRVVCINSMGDHTRI
ncbi:putative late blight resistance protein homolog R1B-14 [Salvia miltiorrhiza]|uniref:putative late blight resistance protein homolog R1B-14 n=1 Tax=Salvia miltiorrhiza TaxID=226208 RepID=UPI0025AB7C42|nr:putative late blight resistance protein homolog R1B-14 [Salvia miltiorrhiza]